MRWPTSHSFLNTLFTLFSICILHTKKKKIFVVYAIGIHGYINGDAWRDGLAFIHIMYIFLQSQQLNRILNVLIIHSAQLVLFVFMPLVHFKLWSFSSMKQREARRTDRKAYWSRRQNKSTSFNSLVFSPTLSLTTIYIHMSISFRRNFSQTTTGQQYTGLL